MKDVAWYDWVEGGPLDATESRRRRLCPRLTGAQLEALWQLRMTVWDGYLISKTARDELVSKGLVTRLNGWQVITREGLAVLDTYGLLEDVRYGTRGSGAGGKLWTLKPEHYAGLRKEGLVT